MERVCRGEATETGGGARGQQGLSGKPHAVKKPEGRLAVPCTPAPLGPPAPAEHPWNCPEVLAPCRSHSPEQSGMWVPLWCYPLTPTKGVLG